MSDVVPFTRWKIPVTELFPARNEARFVNAVSILSVPDLTGLDHELWHRRSTALTWPDGQVRILLPSITLRPFKGSAVLPPPGYGHMAPASLPCQQPVGPLAPPQPPSLVEAGNHTWVLPHWHPNPWVVPGLQADITLWCVRLLLRDPDSSTCAVTSMQGQVPALFLWHGEILGA